MRSMSIGLFVVVAFSSASCTRFAFKGNGKGTAPEAQKDPARMVRLDGGNFQMGAPSGEPDEFPVHPVTLGSFFIDKTEVTRADYAACVNEGVCAAARLTEGQKDDDEDPQAGSHPVVGVNWFDASKYCAWVEKRLPTEAEWEFAARFPKWGFYVMASTEQVSMNVRGSADGFAKTAPVGSFAAGTTSTGLADMSGNASEWTADWYDAIYYQSSPTDRPTGPDTSTGTRVVRGGAWSDNAYSCRLTTRRAIDPNVSNDAVGFRCAR
jgi:formylglycine-generating enzyme required for sulfatase activity